MQNAKKVTLTEFSGCVIHDEDNEDDDNKVIMVMVLKCRSS